MATNLDEFGDTISTAGKALQGALGAEKEPMLLLDTTGSMHRPNSPDSSVSRIDVVHEALGVVVASLAAQDSQAAHEEGGGGLRTITFASGEGHDIDDINPGNFAQTWSSIKFEGTTQIMPGVAALFAAYNDEFGDREPLDRPRMLILVITDGEADDTDQFAKLCTTLKGNMFVEIGLLGYGDEHDAAQKAYEAVAAQNQHVKVTSFGNQTDPQAIAKGLLDMIA
jgi:hypothetical protein